MNANLHTDLFYLCHPVGQLKELNRRADLGAIKEKLDELYSELEDLDPVSCADAVAWMSSEIDRMHYGIQRKNFDKFSTSGDKTMKEFMPVFVTITKQDAIKLIADYFNTHKFENVGIVFEKQKDATAFLDEVKGLVNKENSEVWNKKSIYNKNKVRILTDNVRSRSRILAGWTCEKLFIEAKCLEKYKEDILACCVCPQCALNPDNVDNFCIIEEKTI